MAAKEMYDYLSFHAADYTATTLSLDPTNQIVEEGDKNQEVHKAADGLTREVIDFGSDSVFTVLIEWGYLSEADAGTLIDFFHDPAKANGFERSIRWAHPTDGHVYTVAFGTPVPRVISTPAKHSVKQIKLEVLGYTS